MFSLNQRFSNYEELERLLEDHRRENDFLFKISIADSKINRDVETAKKFSHLFKVYTCHKYGNATQLRPYKTNCPFFIRAHYVNKDNCLKISKLNAIHQHEKIVVEKQCDENESSFEASWDAERRELLRRELLAQQICEAMIPHLRPGCPLRDLQTVRSAATWSTELGRWRLPDVSSNSSHLPLPPASLRTPPPSNEAGQQSKADLNNNSNNGNNHTSGSNDSSMDDDSNGEDQLSEPDNAGRSNGKEINIADVYFKRNRVDKLLANVREAKTFDTQLNIPEVSQQDTAVTSLNENDETSCSFLSESMKVFSISSPKKKSLEQIEIETRPKREIKCPKKYEDYFKKQK